MQRKVLIVDDSEEIRATCRNVLMRYNFNVSVARDAKEALQKLDNTFDLVITDLLCCAQHKRSYVV